MCHAARISGVSRKFAVKLRREQLDQINLRNQIVQKLCASNSDFSVVQLDAAWSPIEAFVRNGQVDEIIQGICARKNDLHSKLVQCYDEDLSKMSNVSVDWSALGSRMAVGDSVEIGGVVMNDLHLTDIRP